jgi:hypothetical protein
MSLIASHSQVINRYRSLFTALHEFSAVPTGRSLSSSRDVTEAWDLFKSCRDKAERLEKDLDEEREKAETYREKTLAVEEMLNALREGTESQLNLQFAQRVHESRVEVGTSRKLRFSLES